MSDFSLMQSNTKGFFRNLSMGVKLIIVCALALAMCIPGFFVSGLVVERTQRADDVAKEIGGDVGGSQTFLGPTLAVPYTIPPATPSDHTVQGTYLVFPVLGNASLAVATEERHRSLFRVPVYKADVKFDADFDLTGVPAAAPQGAQMDWAHSVIVVGVSNVHGALADATLTTPTGSVAQLPTEVAERLLIGDEGHRIKLSLLGGGIGDLAKPGAKFHVSSALKFSGAERIEVLAFGKSTHVKIASDWRNPGFYGAALPVTHPVTQAGFTAEWSVPSIARGVHSEGPSNLINGLESTALGVNFVEVADPYQSVERSLKYILLFLGLVFLSYFVFEATTGKRVHPAQYILVGMAQIIFYLLLLSFAERIGFNYGFMLAGSATVILLSANAVWVFASRLQGLRALVIFTMLYTLIYLLLTLEDNALLVGAVASFLAVAGAMYLTRRVDWHGSLPTETATTPGVAK